MKTKALVFSMTLLLASFPLFAAYDAFLKIDTIQGESTSPSHPGWMDIESFSWGAGATTAPPTTAAKCSLHEFHFTSRVNKASAKLSQAAMSGQLLGNVTVEVNGERHMLQGAQIKSVQNGNGPNGPLQLVTLNFTRCMTHETSLGSNALQKGYTVKLDTALKLDSNGMIALGAGQQGDAIAMQDLHFTGPNQAVMTVRKAGGGSNAILIGLLRASTNGKHIPQVAITARKAGGGQQEYYKITLTDVLVSSYQQSAVGGGGGAGFDQLTLNFAKLDGPMMAFHDVFIK